MVALHRPAAHYAFESRSELHPSGLRPKFGPCEPERRCRRLRAGPAAGREHHTGGQDAKILQSSDQNCGQRLDVCFIRRRANRHAPDHRHGSYGPGHRVRRELPRYPASQPAPHGYGLAHPRAILRNGGGILREIPESCGVSSASSGDIRKSGPGLYSRPGFLGVGWCVITGIRDSRAAEDRTSIRGIQRHQQLPSREPGTLNGQREHIRGDHH